MRIDPANIAQVREAEDGSYIEVSSDAGTVADDLRRIDAGFKVRLKVTDVPRGKEFWAVYHERHEGCEHNGTADTYLVNTWPAYQNHSGTWEGLDQRAVRRVEQIGHSSYDYARELEAHNQQVEREKKREMSEHLGQVGERGAHALRKDLGAKYKGGIYVPRAV